MENWICFLKSFVFTGCCCCWDLMWIYSAEGSLSHQDGSRNPLQPGSECQNVLHLHWVWFTPTPTPTPGGPICTHARVHMHLLLDGQFAAISDILSHLSFVCCGSWCDRSLRDKAGVLTLDCCLMLKDVLWTEPTLKPASFSDPAWVTFLPLVADVCETVLPAVAKSLGSFWKQDQPFFGCLVVSLWHHMLLEWHVRTRLSCLTVFDFPLFFIASLIPCYIPIVFGSL